MPVEPGASADPPTDEDGEIDWVMLASMQSFPASDAPAYPASASAPKPHVDDERKANP
jgi:hypothetical protein